MLFRLIGKLYFYFIIVPFAGRVLRAVADNYVEYGSRKAADPTWTFEKQHAENQERLNRRRARRCSHR